MILVIIHCFSKGTYAIVLHCMALYCIVLYCTVSYYKHLIIYFSKWWPDNWYFRTSIYFLHISPFITIFLTFVHFEIIIHLVYFFREKIFSFGDFLFFIIKIVEIIALIKILFYFIIISLSSSTLSLSPSFLTLSLSLSLSLSLPLPLSLPLFLSHSLPHFLLPPLIHINSS